MTKRTIIEAEMSDGSIYQFHRKSLEHILSTSHSEERRSKKADEDAAELDRVWDAYQASVNMTASELEAWADDPCSHMASLSRDPIERNLHLLKTPKSDWGEKEIDWAKRTISFVARMSGNAAGDPVSDECQMSKRTISLRNWARDPNKSTKADRALSQVLKREMQLALKSEEEQTVFGLVLEPNDGEDGAPLNPDTQNEIYGREVIRAAAHGWMLNHRIFDIQHEIYLGEHQAKVVESYLAPVDFDLPMPDGSTRRIYRGTWLMVVKILDAKLWKAIKDGKINGFSMNGFVSRENVKIRKTKAAESADVLCLYHRDQDGAMSAAIVRNSMGGELLDLMPVQYGEPLPWADIQRCRKIYMVDFMPQPFCELECLVEICDACGIEFVLIDHHAHAVEALQASPLAGKIEGLQESAELEGTVPREQHEAGCDLTWRFFFGDEQKPAIVELVGRWDVWDHRDELVRPIAFWLESVGFDPTMYEGLFDTTREDLNMDHGDEGRAIYSWMKGQFKSLMKNAFPVEFGGLKCLAINSTAKGSIQFEQVKDVENYQAAIAFRAGPGGWTVSMYALQDDVDVGAVCVAHGGGGHRGAAGFKAAELPFDLPQ